jgi:hypothetical protein
LVDKLPGDSSEWAIMPKPEAPQIVFMDRPSLGPLTNPPYGIPSTNPIVI